MVRRKSLTTSMGLLALVACGARTGLDAGRGGSGGEGPAVPCVPGTTDLQKATPTLMLVIDASGSMGFDLGNSQESRWTALRDALSTTLPPVDDTMRIGALIYPSGGGHGALSCEVPTPDLGPAEGNVDSLLSILAQREPDGATPTSDALTSAATALRGVRAASTARSLVLATDGGPNCNLDLDPKSCTCVLSGGCHDSGRMCLDETRTVGVIAGLAARGIPTYVIGIASNDDDQFEGVLNAMATAGGRPRAGEGESFYAVTSPTDLDNALVTIRDQVGACTYLTSSVPDESGSIIVSIDGAEVPLDNTGSSGWSWGDQRNGEIVFGSSSCSILSSGAHSITATVTCGPSNTSSGSLDGSTSATSSSSFSSTHASTAAGG